MASPRAAGVLPCRADGARDRARERQILRQELGHRVGVGIGADLGRAHAHRLEQGTAHRRLVGALVLEQEVVVHVEQPRRVFGALDVATDPVERLRDPAQHARHALPQRVIAAAAVAAGCRARAAGRARARWWARWARPRAERSGRVLPASVPVGEHPRVLRPAALAGVHDQAAFRERDARQAARHDPDVAPVVHRERPEVEVARPHSAVDERGGRREPRSAAARSTRAGWRAT